MLVHQKSALVWKKVHHRRSWQISSMAISKFYQTRPSLERSELSLWKCVIAKGEQRSDRRLMILRIGRCAGSREGARCVRTNLQILCCDSRSGKPTYSTPIPRPPPSPLHTAHPAYPALPSGHCTANNGLENPRLCSSCFLYWSSIGVPNSHAPDSQMLVVYRAA